VCVRISPSPATNHCKRKVIGVQAAERAAACDRRDVNTIHVGRVADFAARHRIVDGF